MSHILYNVRLHWIILKITKYWGTYNGAIAQWAAEVTLLESMSPEMNYINSYYDTANIFMKSKITDCAGGLASDRKMEDVTCAENGNKN